MKKKRWISLLTLLLAFGLVAAACGDDDDDDGGSAGGEGALAGLCPDPLVIQTDWFPESEHGAMYELIGDDYTVDTDQKTVSGSMVLGGEDLGIEIEVRAGGPAVGRQPVATLLATDDDITLGYASTDGQVLRFEESPLLSVVAPLEQNPQIVMWDPQGIPEAETIADLGELGTTIRVFGPATWQDVLAGLGVISADQIDPSYDGSPAVFIAEGDVAQQGFASSEPYEYENNIPEYGREVAFQLLSDAGFEVYSQTVAIRPDKQEELDDCLKELVPIIQQAVVDYYNDPDRTNALIVDAVEQQDTFWSYDAGKAAWSTQTQLDLGLAGNGPDGTVGNMDTERLQRVIDSMRTAGLDFPDDLGPDDLVTNEYIDDSIGF